MPVYLQGIPPYKIKPPVSAGDNGAPSASLLKDLARMENLILDERHIVAHDLYQSIRKRLQQQDNAGGKRAAAAKKESPKRGVLFRNENNNDKEATLTAEEERIKAKQILDSKQEMIYKLENRARLFRQVVENSTSAVNWKLATRAFGVETYYRTEEDGTVSLKIEGELKGVSLFEQVCVLKELDLHCKWVPFCSSSLVLADIDKLDTVGWFLVGFPIFGLAQDGCMRAIGCDNMSKDDSVLIYAQGVRDIPPGKPPHKDGFLSADPVLDKIDFPPVPKARGSSRITIRTFQARFEVSSPTSVRTDIVANVDPNIPFLPQAVVDFAMKYLAGVLLVKLQSTAKKIAKKPVDNPHAKKMRQERLFYKEWLMEKFVSVCVEKGWEMPPVAAFEVTEEQLIKAGENMRSHTFHGSDDEDNDDDDAVVNPDGTGSNGRKGQQRAASERPAAHLQLPQASRTTTQARMLHTNSSDSVSELSAISTNTNSSRWSSGSGPIRNMIRAKRERERLQKEANEADARRRVKERLRPRAWSSSQRKRLNELKAAKASRSAGSLGSGDSVAPSADGTTAASVRSGSSLETLTWTQMLMERLHYHGKFTRFMMATTLTVLLFALLAAAKHILPGMTPTTPPPSRYYQLMLDAAALAYIGLCSVVHMLLFDVMLVYSFDALELGSRAGQQIKRFYSDNAREAVASFSFGMVAISVGSALLKLMVRVTIWWTLRLEGWVIHLILEMLNGIVTRAVPQDVIDFAISSYHAMSPGMSWGIKVVSFLGRWAHYLFVSSNALGRSVEGLAMTSVKFIEQGWNQGYKFVNDSVQGIEGTIAIPSWREEALDTSRWFFAYTAVFAMVLSLLFRYFAPRSPAPEKKQATTPMAAHMSSGSLMQQIPEESEVNHAMQSPGVTLPEYDSPSRRGQLRKRSQSSRTNGEENHHQGSSSSLSSLSPGMHRAQTM